MKTNQENILLVLTILGVTTFICLLSMALIDNRQLRISNQTLMDAISKNATAVESMSVLYESCLNTEHNLELAPVYPEPEVII